MENRSIALNKRLNSDRNVSLILGIAIAVVGVLQTATFFVGGDPEAIRRAVHAFTCAIVLFIIYRALSVIRKEGRPFTDKIIKYLRTAAVVIMIGGFLPPFLEMAAATFKGDMYTWNMGDFDLLVPVIGVTVGIISEMFVYGKDLQEDNDLIA